MSRPSTPGSAEGFSLIELVVTMTLLLAISAAALTLSLSSRRLYETDHGRTRLNQNLRAGVDMLGADVRQAGERLPDDFPAIEIIDGGGAPDALALRRNLIDQVLPVCSDVAAADTEITIALTVAPPPGCAPLPDDDADGWPDNLGAWRAYRVAAGGSARAYIYNPVTGNGEFFSYVLEDNPGLWIRRDAVGPLQFSYDAADQCRVYILEERRYSLAGDLLQMSIDGSGGLPDDLVDGIRDFQARAGFQDGTWQDSLGPADVWSQLRSIEVTLDGRVDVRGEPFERSLTAQFFPRNVLSR